MYNNGVSGVNYRRRFHGLFPKKDPPRQRRYLSIVESFYNPEKKGTAHKVYKSLGSVETHLANGMEDPIAHFQAEVDDYGESSKYVNFTDEAGGKVVVSLNRKAIEKDLQLAGYNLLVTSETKMADADIYAAYHNLWRIEESFRIMKSDLDARPAFVQKESSIKGHFLICYITVLLERLFQFKILADNFGPPEVFGFIKGFRVTHAQPKCINVATDSPFIRYLADITNLPLRSYYLSKSQIQSVLIPFPI